MKRFLPSVLAISSVFALAALAGADDHRHQGQHDNHRQQQKQYGFGGWGGVSEIVSDFKSHSGHKHQPKNNPIPIDPGRGDGKTSPNPRPPAPPATPPARDGFVWVNGHWERAKAPAKPVTPYPAGPIVRDHRETPVVRDHRETPVVRDHRTAPVVRDHRTTTGNASGGVTVTVINPTAAKDGVTIRDHRTTPVVRDHRTTPVVRDHRATPEVRDHRTAGN